MSKSSSPKGNPPTLKEWLQEALRKVFRNWPVKLLALVLSVVLWATLITQDASLTRPLTFTDVPISVSGSDALKRSGYIVTSDLDELPTVTVTAEVPQLEYNRAQASSYNIRVDLTKIHETGEQTLSVVSSTSQTYGSVSSIEPSTITVNVEPYEVRSRIPVTIQTEGELPEGYYASTPTLDPQRLAISGPKSLVDKVVRAVAVLNLSELPTWEGTIRTAIPFTLYDAQGEPVESDLLEVTSESVLLDTVIAEVTLYPTATVDLNDVGLVTGTPASGYEIKSVTLVPNMITVAGKSEYLDLLDSLFLESTIDVTGASESLTHTIRVRKPTELNYLSSDTVSVAVEIGPVITSKTYRNLRYTITGADSGTSVSGSPSRLDVTITGEQNQLEALRSGGITLTCDVTGLAPGIWELPVSATFPEGYDSLALEDLTVTVTLKSK